MRLIWVIAGLQGKTLDAASPHAPATAASLEATVPARRVLLLEGIASGEVLLVVASIVAVNRGGALHGAATLRAVNDGTASLSCVPFLGEATGRVLWLRGEERSLVVVDGSGTSVGGSVGSGACVSVVDVGGALVRVGKVRVRIGLLERVRRSLRRRLSL